ncbi:MAG: hypothetical protein M1823_002416 [Watsoniomyces obsoletus]|nr:MAG: hypothetical protein M1823_002416 [Watsoniomyces obsoletus]
MFAASTASSASFAHGPTAASEPPYTSASASPFTSLHYIEKSLSRAAAADPKSPTTRAQVESRYQHQQHPRQPSASHSTTTTATTPRRSPPMYGQAGTAPPTGMYVKALYDYEADDRTSLSFHQGDVIQVLTQLESGWWDGVLHGVRGWFPSNYCVLLTDPDDATGHARQPFHVSSLDGTAEGSLYDDDEDDEEDDEERDEDDDDDDLTEDDVELDADGNPIDESPGLPLEGTDLRAPDRSAQTMVNTSAGVWLPQATANGKLYYINTETYETTLELPLETPTSATEAGPSEPGRTRLGSSSTHHKLQPQHLVQGTAHTEHDRSVEEVHPMSEMEMIDTRGHVHPSNRGAPINVRHPTGSPAYHGADQDGRQRSRQDSVASRGLSPAQSIDSIGGMSPMSGRRHGDPVFHYPSGGFTNTNGQATTTTTTSTIPLGSASNTTTGSALTGLNAATAHAMPDSFFEPTSATPLTWNRLVENMRLAVERYRQAILNSERSEYVRRADDISDHLRMLLAAGSGTTDNHSGQPSIILTNKPLYPHFRDMMSKFSKLVLSSHIAATDWPTPESYAKCLHEAEGVLHGVYGYVEVARQQRGEDLPRLVPGFVLGASVGGSWQHQGLHRPSDASHDSHGHPAEMDGDDDFDMTRLDGQVLTRLEDLQRLVAISLRHLEERLTIADQVVTAPAHEVLADSVCSAAAQVLDVLKVWLSTVESINLASHGSPSRIPALSEFGAQKQRVYDLAAELLLGCQAVAGPLGDEWSEIRGDSLQDRLGQVRMTCGDLDGVLSHLTELLHDLEEMKSAGTRNKIQQILGENAPSPAEVAAVAAAAASPPPIVHAPPPPLPPASQSSSDTPDFLRLDLEEELLFDTKSNPPQLRGGTLAALVEQLTRHDKLDSDFNNTFLLTYRSFTNASELFDLLVMRFSVQPPQGLAPQDYQAWADLKQMPIRLRVVNIMKSWFGTYWMEGQDEKSRELIRRAYDFASKSIATSNTPGAQSLMTVLDQRLRGQEVTPRELIRNTNTACPTPIVPKNMKKLKFLDIDVVEFARQLTLIDAGLFAKIKPNECLNRTKKQKTEEGDAPNVKALILHSNRLTNWVAEMILTQAEVKKRVLVIKHFIAIADKCRQLNNFSTTTSIISAMGTAPIDRLKRTWDGIPPKMIASLEAMRKLMAGAHNYSDYRQALHHAVPPCVPFFGVYLTDLLFIEDGMPAMLKNSSLINVTKRTKTAEVIRHVQGYQNVPYLFQPVPELQEYILSNMRQAGDVHEMYERSLVVEPREREDEKIARLLSESGLL